MFFASNTHFEAYASVRRDELDASRALRY